jgi:hypothetical protein
MTTDITQSTVASDYNLLTLNTEQYSQHLAATLAVGSNLAIFGRRGIGKTAIIEQEIKKAGMKEAYINLSVLERVDLGGYPKLLNGEDRKRFVEYILPDFYAPMVEGSTPVVALLDEVDKADCSLQAPLLEMVQRKTINGIKLLNLRSVVMTGNLITEGSQRPIQPLLDRTEKYRLEANIKAFLAWAAVSKTIHTSITTYLTDHPQHLVGPEDSIDNYGDPSPRSWTNASALLFQGETRNWSSDLLSEKVCGCVGKQVGINYQVYFEWYKDLLPIVDYLFEGDDMSSAYKKLKDKSEQFVACSMVCARLASFLDEYAKLEVKFPKELNWVGRFLQQVEQETVLVSLRNEMGHQRIWDWKLTKHEAWPFMRDLYKLLYENNE